MTFSKTGYADTTLRGVFVEEDEEVVFKNCKNEP